MSMFADLRLAVRSLAARPTFSILVVLTLALGIGANVGVASVVRGLLLAEPPFAEPERLVEIWGEQAGVKGRLSLRDVADLRERTELFTDIAVYAPDAAYNLSGDGRPEEVSAVLATGNLFRVLGVPLLHGEPWPSEYDSKRNYGVILSHGLWQRRYVGDPAVLGSKITMDAAPYYVVFGVLPRGFDFPVKTEIFRSLAYYDLEQEDRSVRAYGAVARLREGVSHAEVQSALATLSADLGREFSDTNQSFALVASPLSERYVREARPFLLLLLGAVALVLLAASVNVGHLLFARAMARELETALRTALGASRAVLARQVVTEGLVLALVGGLAGVALAAFAVARLPAAIATQLPPWVSFQLDLPLLGFAVGLALFVGLSVSLVPLVAVFKSRSSMVLKQGSRDTGNRFRERLRKALVVAQVAMAMTLLVGAALLMRSFQRLESTNPGYRTENLATFRVALSWRAYQDDAKVLSFYRDLVARLSALPGVEGVSHNSNLPLSEEATVAFSVEGEGPEEQQSHPQAIFQVVEPGYFRLMGIPQLPGRGFLAADSPESELVAIVGRRFAERFWPGQEALNKRLKLGAPSSDRPWLRVVGVVEEVRHGHPTGEPGLDLYLPHAQYLDTNAYVVMRTALPAGRLTEMANREVWAIDPD